MNVEKLTELPDEIQNRSSLKISGSLAASGLLLFLYPAASIAFLMISVTLATAVITKRYGLNRFGIETATFTVVVNGAVFGPQIGALLALITIVLQVMTGSGGAYILWVVPGYVAAGLVSGFLGTVSLASDGILITVALQVFFGGTTAVLYPSYVGKFIPRALAAIVFNIVLFRAAAEPVASAMM